MTKLIELLEQRLQPILSQMNTTLQDAANYAMNQPTNDMSAAAVQHDSAGNIINQNSSTSTTTNVNNQTTAKDTGVIGSIEKYFENTLLMQFLNTGR
jgi:hypothetical protein